MASPPQTPVLAARRLTKRFAGLIAVDAMSLALTTGEMVGLIGPNGAGKTTLFNLLAGSLSADGGAVELAGRPVTRLRPEARLRRGLGRTFQIPRPFPAMTVLENVLAGAQRQRGEAIHANFLTPRRVRADERAARARAFELLDFVTLSHLAHRPARVLSGGQRKLLELARILMADPKVLLLDEPAAGVNPQLLETIAERIVAINRGGVTVLLVEHNIELVRALCSRVVVMAEGRLLAEGDCAAVLARTDVADAYLGMAA